MRTALARDTHLPSMEPERASDSSSKSLQAIFTFGIGGLVVLYFWPRLEAISKGIIFIFGAMAALSIYNGTWLQDSRELQRESRNNRRQAYTEVKSWVTGEKKTEEKKRE